MDSTGRRRSSRLSGTGLANNKRSSRLSTRLDNKTQTESVDDEPVVLSSRKRKSSLVSKQDRKVLSAGDSSTDELFNLVQSKKRKSGASSVIKPSKKVIQEESSSESSVDDVESNQDFKRQLLEENESEDEPLFSHIKKEESASLTIPRKEVLEGSSDGEACGHVSVKEESNDDSFDSSAKENCDTKLLQEKQILAQPKAPLSEFEAMRLKNIEERQKMFQELNLGHLKVEMEEQQLVKRSSLAVQRKSSLYFSGSSKATTPSESVRKSARLRGMEAKKLELPPDRMISEYVRRASAPAKGKSSLYHYEGEWDRKQRNSQAVLSLDEALHKSFNGRENSKLLLDCCMRMCLSKDEDHGVLEPDRCSLKEFKEAMDNLTLKEQHKIKVVPNRIYSLAMNPLTHGFLVAAGCKSGAVGLWNISAESTKWDESQLVAFNYHSRPANCITFGMNEPHLMYTTSYDGTIRRVDLQKQDASLIYETPSNRRDNHTCWHVEIEPRVLLLGVGDGSIARLDTRLDNTGITTFRCHDRSLRTISVHPGTKQHFATTSSYNKEVAIWDLRKVNSKRPFSGKVSSIAFNKPLSSAFFSPITGKSILTTSADDKIGVYDCTNLEKPTLVHKLTHNNHTGRWITNFRAVWHPRREDVFVIGSMDRPDRKVEIFKVNSKVELLTELMDEQYLTTIGAVSVFHPHIPAVATGNASGYVHVFM